MNLTEEQKRNLTTALNAMDKANFANRETDIVREGTKIVLPSDPRDMTEDEAINQLTRKKEQLEMKVSIYEAVDCFPLEGAWALMKVLERTYGWVNSVPTPGFFGPKPPTMVTLQTAHETYTQVIWGDFQVPGVEGTIKTSADIKNGQPIFVISGTVKKRFQKEIQTLANAVRDYVKVNSLYKGKAIKIVTMEREDDYGNEKYVMDMSEPPQFLDLSKVNENELVFSETVQEQVNTSLFTPIRKTDLCRQNKIPLKRGILLEGPYGTGKTLTAFVSAKMAIENGWTFVYLDRVMAIKDAMIFARRYAPCVIFTEDIERIVSGERSTEIDDVLNTIDGIDSKNKEIITILTTNHIEKIEKAMLRPGRLDAVITVNPPDAKAAQKLVRVYAGNLIDPNESLEEAGKELDGQIPAVIREVVERSKLYAISRLNTGDTLKITGHDIKHSAIGMKNHLEILNPPKKTEESTPEYKLGLAFKGVMNDTLLEATSTLQ